MIPELLQSKPLFYTSQDDAAAYLGLTQPTFNKLVQGGMIKGERVGVGEHRRYYKFSVSELDRYQLERAKQKLGKRFEKQFEEAQRIASCFWCLNDKLMYKAMIEHSLSYQETSSWRIEPRYLTDENLATECPFDMLLIVKEAFLRYQKLSKALRDWVDNQIYYHVDVPNAKKA